MKQTTTQLEDETIEKLKKLASALNTSFDALLRAIIHHHIKEANHDPSLSA